MVFFLLISFDSPPLLHLQTIFLPDYNARTLHPATQQKVLISFSHNHAPFPTESCHGYFQNAPNQTMLSQAKGHSWSPYQHHHLSPGTSHPSRTHAYPLSVHVLEDNQSCNFRCKYKVPETSSCLSRWQSQTGPADAVITEMEHGISRGPGRWDPLNSRKHVLQALPSGKPLWVSSTHRFYYKCFNKSNEIITSVRTCFLIPVFTISRL